MKPLFPAFLLLLLFLNKPAVAATVDTITVYSAAMQKSFNAAVVLPAGYAQSTKALPVLYLLHGGQGSFRDWLSKTTEPQLLQRLADQYHILIVTPEGGLSSFYFDSPFDKQSQYETHISKEVVEKVDATYRTIRNRNGRVIAGLSMGGHGAMFIAARHPDLFCAAGSMSGVMNIDTKTWQVPPEFAKARTADLARLLGAPKDTSYPYPEYTLVGMTGKLKANDVKLMFDVGVDDFLIAPNRDLHQQLLANGTPHHYIERPGKHDWDYWTHALPYQLLFFQQVLQANGSM